MCDGCYEQYGSPNLDSPEIRECAQLIRDLYLIDGFGCGGDLHIVLDDWNLEDSSLDFCEQYIKDHPGDEYGQDIENEIIELMRPMTLQERASALIKAHQ